jgi:hypothetical protein
MANNVAVTAGSGTTFKTTDNAGVHTGHVNVDASALPTGAATAAAQTTGNASLAALEAALADPATQTTLAAILAKIIAAPATEAKQDTLIGHVDGVEALLTTIDGDTSTLAGAVAGTEVQVDVVGALPAGDNNIGNVDVASSALPTGAATEAKQDTVIGHLDGVEALLGTIDADTSNLAAIASDIGSIEDSIGTTGQATPANSVPVVGAKFSYQHVAASTDEALGAAGATGDYLHGVLIIPGTTSPGSVDIGDSTTDMEIFAGGADSVATLHPFFVPIMAASGAGGWSVITGANVTAIAVGNFTEA